MLVATDEDYAGKPNLIEAAQFPMRHIIALALYNLADLDRFTWLANLQQHLPRPHIEIEYLLVSLIHRDSSRDLEKQLASFAPTHVFGGNHHGNDHPHVAADIFWQTMDFVLTRFDHDDGFVLWMESDMVPAKPDWLERVHREWCDFGSPLVMGQFVDRLPHHLGDGPVPPHITGGACYAKNLSEFVATGVDRQPRFDVSLFNALENQHERVHATSQFAFGAVQLIDQMINDECISLVRGLAQPADEFVRAVISAIEPSIECRAYDGPTYDIGEAVTQGTQFLDIFRAEFKPRLAGEPLHREETFEQMFAYLESKNKDNYLLVETGCARQDSWIDGRSTIQFDNFVRARGGRVVSVDLNPVNCQYSREHTSTQTNVFQEDSISFLSQLCRDADVSIDLLYLDSYDVDWEDVHPSALHHLMEICAAMPALKSGSLVVVDDHVSKDRPGKSLYVLEWMHRIGATELFESYQIGWILP